MNILAALCILFALPFLWGCVVLMERKTLFSILCLIVALGIVSGFCIFTTVLYDNITEDALVVFSYEGEKIYQSNEDGEYFIVVTNNYNLLDIYSKKQIENSFVEDWVSFAEKHKDTIQGIQDNCN